MKEQIGSYKGEFSLIFCSLLMLDFLEIYWCIIEIKKSVHIRNARLHILTKDTHFFRSTQIKI